MRDIRFRDSVPYLVGMLFRRIARVHNRAMKPFEVSAVQAQILTMLWARGAMTIGALQQSLALGSSTLTGALDRMEKLGLVKRAPVEGDRRAYRVEPVAWPAKKKETLVGALEDVEAESFGDLTATERNELVRLLRKALGSIEKVDQGGSDVD